ncbi:hypothetical protein BDK51DRAFT_9806, partial [Blyttiomyces helicus]
QSTGFPYAQQPLGFIQSWRTMANAIASSGAVRSQYALVWGPNAGNGVGYNGGITPDLATKIGTAEYNALDTNGDGEINLLDNPYAPYYPGDEYVDWVGLSVST